MNPEDGAPNEEAQLASIETSVARLFPGFESDRTRIHDTSSGERGILEFYTQEGKDRTKNPIIYALLKRDGGMTAYAQHVKPPEGRVSLIGATSYDFDHEGAEIPWQETDIDLMMAKLRVFTEGVELSDALLNQVSTYSPKLNDLVTFRQRLGGTSNLEAPKDEHEAIDWNEVDPALRAIYEEEMEAIQMSTPRQILGGIQTRYLAALYPSLAKLIVEENIKGGHALPGFLGIHNPLQALDEIRSETPLGKRIIKSELHRLDAIEGILAIRNPKLSLQQSS